VLRTLVARMTSQPASVEAEAAFSAHRCCWARRGPASKNRLRWPHCLEPADLYSQRTRPSSRRCMGCSPAASRSTQSRCWIGCGTSPRVLGFPRAEIWRSTWPTLRSRALSGVRPLYAAQVLDAVGRRRALEAAQRIAQAARPSPVSSTSCVSDCGGRRAGPTCRRNRPMTTATGTLRDGDLEGVGPVVAGALRAHRRPFSATPLAPLALAGCGRRGTCRARCRCIAAVSTLSVVSRDGGKTAIALSCVLEAVRAGETVVIFDEEAEAEQYVEKLLALGARPALNWPGCTTTSSRPRPGRGRPWLPCTSCCTRSDRWAWCSSTARPRLSPALASTRTRPRT